MKKFLCVMAIAAIAAPAMADLSAVDRTNTPIYAPTQAQAIGQTSSLRAGPAIYDSMGPGTGGFAAAPAAVGQLGFDDYETNSGTTLTAIMFAGGATAPGAVLWFEFYDKTTGGYVFNTSFGTQLQNAGNYLYTITLSNPITIPHGPDAALVIKANSTFTGGGAYSTTIAGQWFMTTADAVVVGANDTAVGGGSTTGGAPLVHAFSLHAPEPTTLALLGGGLVFMLRRRR